MSLQFNATYVSLELGDEEAEEGVVEVFTTEKRVAVRRLHLEHALLDLQDRHVESATSQIIHSNTATKK